MLFEHSVECTEGERVGLDVHIRVDSVDQPKYVKIRIEDHSSGIYDDEKEIIFNRFYKNPKGHGCGLGISMVKSVIDRYSGEIHLEDRVKGDHTKGCVFVLRLPTTGYIG
jgi:K+-sensing histidine kinase KdpD